jgi:hypothetical protein
VKHETFVIYDSLQYRLPIQLNIKSLGISSIEDGRHSKSDIETKFYSPLPEKDDIVMISDKIQDEQKKTDFLSNYEKVGPVIREIISFSPDQLKTQIQMDLNSAGRKFFLSDSFNDAILHAPKVRRFFLHTIPKDNNYTSLKIVFSSFYAKSLLAKRATERLFNSIVLRDSMIQSPFSQASFVGLLFEDLFINFFRQSGVYLLMQPYKYSFLNNKLHYEYQNEMESFFFNKPIQVAVSLLDMDPKSSSIYISPPSNPTSDLAVNYQTNLYFIQFSISRKHSFDLSLFSDYFKYPPSSPFVPVFYLFSPNFRKILVCIFHLHRILLNLKAGKELQKLGKSF